MATSTINSDCTVLGYLTCQGIGLPANAVANIQIQTPSPASQGIAVNKTLHLIEKQHTQNPGTAVVTATQLLHLVYGSSCTILGVQVMTTTPPTSSDTVTVQINKGNASTAFATILSSAITLNSSSVTRTVYSGSLVTTTASQGDSLEVVVTASGTSCQGLIVSLYTAESSF